MAAYDRIYNVVQRIPAGRVSTYGEVARVGGASEQRKRLMKEGVKVHNHRVNLKQYRNLFN